jgi:iron(III) transport system permease protein
MRLSRDDVVRGIVLLVLGVFLVAVVLLPIYALLSKSLEDKEGNFVGLANYFEYFSTPALVNSATNTLTIGVVTTVIIVTLAFVYAYALTRSCMPFKGLFRSIALIPILAPSLLPAISLVYLFGNQGMIQEALLGYSIYGPIGIVMALGFWIFPHTVMILRTALATSDARLYEAAAALRASKARTFLSVTLPAVRYGLMSACFVAFTYAITDFGAPKVIGGWYSVLSVDIYKQVVGQWNFQMGAVVSVVLLFPVVITFVADRLVQRRQVAQLSARSVPYEPKPNRRFDLIMFAYCSVVSLVIVGILAVSAYASFITFWPYNLDLTLVNYAFDYKDGGSWDAYTNSIILATLTAVIGSLVIFCGAYARHGARPRLHLLLQPGDLHRSVHRHRAAEPFYFSLSDNGDPGDLHRCSLLHSAAPDCAHRTETARFRIRGGIRIAQRAVLQNVYAGDVPGVPARHPRDRHLPLRQCDDDRLGGGLSVGARDQARFRRGAQHG